LQDSNPCASLVWQATFKGDESMLETVSWFVTTASIVGTVLNIRKSRVGFAVWFVTNCTWVVIDIYLGLFAQSFMFAIYAALAAWGWFAWEMEMRP
jgi:nicotinamide riboside transporter PnuC